MAHVLGEPCNPPFAVSLGITKFRFRPLTFRQSLKVRPGWAVARIHKNSKGCLLFPVVSKDHFSACLWDVKPRPVFLGHVLGSGSARGQAKHQQDTSFITEAPRVDGWHAVVSRLTRGHELVQWPSYKPKAPIHIKNSNPIKLIKCSLLDRNFRYNCIILILIIQKNYGFAEVEKLYIT